MAPIINVSEKEIKLLDSMKQFGFSYKPVKPVKKAKEIQPKNSIFLEARQHGNYTYPDLLVSTERSYLGQSWEQCKEQLATQNNYMLTIRQFADFLNVLKSGKAFDERGKKVSSQKLQALYNEITEVRSPWRAEHLDAKFGDKTITYTLIETDGSTREVTERLGDALMNDRIPGINLDSWLKTADEHGLPTLKTENGNLYYWYPREGAVARFYADSNVAYLICDRYPDYHYDSLGVRLVEPRTK